MRNLGLGDLAFLGAVGGVAAYDADAQAYITAVEAADGQALETAVRDAINAFVVGCKADGIWTAIKASCILAGARTLNGALVPLAGTAPTNFNFVSGDYNRKTGLVGNGSTKYLNSNRSNNADPQNSRHCAAWVTTIPSSFTFSCVLGAGSNTSGAVNLALNSPIEPDTRNLSTTIESVTTAAMTDPFYGMSRAASGSYIARYNNTSYTQNVTSSSPSSDNVFIYARNDGRETAQFPFGCRLAFYSIGESLGLALLDARVTALINAFAAAIP